jgi:hypothetical protein
MAKDMLGNELQVGHQVMMMLDKPVGMGEVVEIREGGVISGLRRGGSEARPGFVVVICKFETPYDPMMPILGNMVRLHNPKRDEMEEGGKTPMLV